MMTKNKLTKTFASGALTIGVLAGSVLTATSASAASLSWAAFKAGGVLVEGDKKVTYVSDTFTNLGADTFVSFNQAGPEYTVAFTALSMTNEAASFTYEIEIVDPQFHFTGVQVDSDVTVNNPIGYGDVDTFLAEPNLTLTSENGWPDPQATATFLPIPGSLTKLTVTNTLKPNAGGALMSSSNKFTQGTKVPEPGTILGLLTVGGLGLVSRFKR
ncbi:hypothetical protein MiAbW_01704 [Microcystis aeruginosa NIES-4325]|uniref:Ice-binding protein C-terminal domain-containing protein n=1 Tax=Microcystis aeruginosa NIES-4325 TaxID=2569534 RepID=A0A5J4F916_MICAE|nr:PEP-CTERM sorting domain-containing protein [Microcystis aeruginosa]GEA27144.1 hypothetical protein MiAbW_01704 [Microcystis aeruginosa NIES-4325]